MDISGRVVAGILRLLAIGPIRRGAEYKGRSWLREVVGYC